MMRSIKKIVQMEEAQDLNKIMIDANFLQNTFNITPVVTDICRIF